MGMAGEGREGGRGTLVTTLLQPPIYNFTKFQWQALKLITCDLKLLLTRYMFLFY